MRQRWTSKHMIIVLTELKKDKQPGLQTSLKCFIHPTQDLKLYCVNCNVVACHNCTILLHKGHKFESIERAKQHIIRKFSEAVERNQRYHDFVNDSIFKLNGSIGKINDKAEIVEVTIFLKFSITFLDSIFVTLTLCVNEPKCTFSFKTTDGN